VRRELLYVEDLADALVFLMNHFDAGREREDEKMFVNIGLAKILCCAIWPNWCATSWATQAALSGTQPCLTERPASCST